MIYNHKGTLQLEAYFIIVIYTASQGKVSFALATSAKYDICIVKVCHYSCKLQLRRRYKD
jgi:hypothetical protein